MIRPAWTLKTDAEREALSRLEVRAEEFRAAEQRMWEAANAARELRIPPDLIAEKTGFSRATVYRETDRRFGRAKGDTDG